MSIIFPGENFESRIIYPEVSFEKNNFGMQLKYNFLPFKELLTGGDNIKIGNIISYGKDGKEYDHLLNLYIILIKRIRKLFDEIKQLPNQNFLKIDGENSYKYMIIFEIFRQLDSLLELEYPNLKEEIKKAGINLGEPYFILDEIIKIANNLHF